MTRRLLVAVICLLCVSTPAFGDSVQPITAKKQQVDSKIQALKDSLGARKASESSLQTQIDGFTSQIRTLETKVGDVSLKLTTLERDVRLHQQRLHALAQLYVLQTQRLNTLKAQYDTALKHLTERLVTIYMSGEPSTWEVYLGSGSLNDMISQSDFVRRIGHEDKLIAAKVDQAKRSMQASRVKTRAVRSKVKGEERVIAARAAQTRSVKLTLLGAKNALDVDRQQKLVALSSLSAKDRAEAEEIDALKAASESLAAQIRAAQQTNSGAPTATPSSAGLIWPVSGPVTSPYGWRWGRMHEGIDIGVSTGTPIRAAATGKVIYCGWEEGYGNLVILDNGGNLATAYGHQSSIAVTCGQVVSQGQTLGYVGCTGHCTGPHLHFEVRINGNPVDPMGYL